MRIKQAVLLFIFTLGVSAVYGLGFSNSSATTLMRRTSYDIFGSQGSYSPVYELVQFDWQGKEDLGGSVYMRGRTGNVYYSNASSDLLVYAAYADWKANDNLVLRGGRQTIYQDIRIFSLDGLKVDIPTFFRPNVAVSAYLGKPAELYATDPGTNMLGFRTSIAVRDNASLAFDYQTEQKSGNALTSIGGVRGSATLGQVDVAALANYDLARSVVKNYKVDASLPVRKGLVLQGKYDAQTPDFDPQSVYSVFNYAYQQVQHASAGVDYGLDEDTNVYAWLGTITQDQSKGFDWRLGVGNKGGLLGYDTSFDYYKTQGLDGDREDLSCSASKNVTDKFVLSGRLNYGVAGGDKMLIGGVAATVKPRDNVDLSINWQSVMGGFTPNSKLMASASINLGE
jgi:hypothetical protein